MAFADLMLGAFTLPFYIYLVGDDYQLWTAKYDSEHMAHKIFYASFDNIFLLGSYISAASISCERFYAVFWPFKHRSLSTRTYRITEFLSFSKRCVLAIRRGDQPLSKNQKTKPKSCTHNARDRTKNITKQPQSPAS